MNNSQIAMENISLELENNVDIKPTLRAKEQDLVEIIEAIEKVSSSSYWKTLKLKVLDGVLSSLQTRIKNEKNPTEIYRLQGQIIWAEKYCDLEKLAQAYQNELLNLRTKLNAK